MQSGKKQNKKKPHHKTKSPTTTAKPGKTERNQQSTGELLRPLCFSFTVIGHFVCQIPSHPPRDLKAEFMANRSLNIFTGILE